LQTVYLSAISLSAWLKKLAVINIKAVRKIKGIIFMIHRHLQMSRYSFVAIILLVLYKLTQYINRLANINSTTTL
jgi:hypothetical protein